MITTPAARCDRLARSAATAAAAAVPPAPGTPVIRPLPTAVWRQRLDRRRRQARRCTRNLGPDEQQHQGEAPGTLRGAPPLPGCGPRLGSAARHTRAPRHSPPQASLALERLQAAVTEALGSDFGIDKERAAEVRRHSPSAAPAPHRAHTRHQQRHRGASARYAGAALCTRTAEVCGHPSSPQAHPPPHPGHQGKPALRELLLSDPCFSLVKATTRIQVGVGAPAAGRAGC